MVGRWVSEGLQEIGERASRRGHDQADVWGDVNANRSVRFCEQLGQTHHCLLPGALSGVVLAVAWLHWGQGKLRAPRTPSLNLLPLLLDVRERLAVARPASAAHEALIATVIETFLCVVQREQSPVGKGHGARHT